MSKFDGETSLVIEVDVLPVGIGAVLIQKQKIMKILLRRKLHETEQRYSQIDCDENSF